MEKKTKPGKELLLSQSKWNGRVSILQAYRADEATSLSGILQVCLSQVQLWHEMESAVLFSNNQNTLIFWWNYLRHIYKLTSLILIQFLWKVNWIVQAVKSSGKREKTLYFWCMKYDVMYIVFKYSWCWTGMQFYFGWCIEVCII